MARAGAPRKANQHEAESIVTQMHLNMHAHEEQSYRYETG
jgi:hypothetical protein